jgi:hypothetical protein
MPQNPFFKIFCIFGIGILLYTIARKFPRISCFLFLVLPIGLLPIWLKNDNINLFLWVKVYLVSTTAFFVSFVRCYKSWEKFSFFAIYSLVFANILFPIWVMMSTGTLLSHLNALSGLLLLASLPSLQSLKVSHDLLWDVSYSWILGYKLWNWLLVYYLFPNAVMNSIGLLLTPLILSFFNRKIWLQARAYTLAIFLILGLSFWDFANPNISPVQINQQILLCLSVILVCWMLIFCFARKKGDYPILS